MIMVEKIIQNIDKVTSILGLDLNGFEFKYDFNFEGNGLNVSKQENKITISCSEKAYLFRALGLFKENIDKPSFSITENASFTMNGIMLDCSRGGAVRISEVKKIIEQLALMGHNTLMLYTEDTYELEGHPYFGYMRGRYTIEELREIDDYAYGFGIEIIPCIQTLGHLEQVFKWGRTYSDIIDTERIIMVGEEKSYTFIEEMISTCRKAFRSKRIHVGMDEAHELGRGKYYDKYGDSNIQQLFLKHLELVENICNKYEFRPMIWGDMLLRVAGCSGYTDCDVDTDSLNLDIRIPDSIDYVYWDYYSTTPERYSEFIRAHKRSAKNVIFSGGAWRWSNFVPSMKHSLATSRMALEECKKSDIKEVFVTLWGDNGNESSTYCVWPVVQLFAEYNFNDINEVDLAKRFNTCTGGNWNDYCALEMLNLPCGHLVNAADNPSKYLFYQDPMIGLHDYYVLDSFNEYYTECAEKLHTIAERTENNRYIFDTAEALSRVLADKAELGIRIKRAYDNGDRAMLQNIVEEVIPRIIANVEKFRECFEIQWNNEFRIFGFEVMDNRFGALVNRLYSAKKRITGYLDGRINALEELEEERLPFDGQKTDTVLAHVWSQNVSVSGV